MLKYDSTHKFHYEEMWLVLNFEDPTSILQIVDIVSKWFFFFKEYSILIFVSKQLWEGGLENSESATPCPRKLLLIFYLFAQNQPTPCLITYKPHSGSSASMKREAPSPVSGFPADASQSSSTYWPDTDLINWNTESDMDMVNAVENSHS